MNLYHLLLQSRGNRDSLPFASYILWRILWGGGLPYITLVGVLLMMRNHAWFRFMSLSISPPITRALSIRLFLKFNTWLKWIRTLCPWYWLRAWVSIIFVVLYEYYYVQDFSEWRGPCLSFFLPLLQYVHTSEKCVVPSYVKKSHLSTYDGYSCIHFHVLPTHCCTD